MARFILLFGMLLSTASLMGCSESTNGLATDSGKMTLEEYEAMQKAEEATIAESMKSPAQ